jgi:NAD(P)H-flavin reductase/hemoglobin-like flavoprotein
VNVAALKESWAQVAPQGDRAAEFFYATLFTLDPSVRGMFPLTMGGQRGKLLAALGHIVSNVDDGEVLVEFVKQLGGDHRRFEVRPEHYPVVGQALLHTLAKGLGAAWTDELAADWAEAYGIVSSVMLQAASEGEQHEPAWWDAEIIAHERRTGDIAVFTVRPAYPIRYKAGQSVAVESHLRPRVWRYLSPANVPRRGNTIDFHVRAIPGGQLSPALVYHAQVGDTLRVGSPIGSRLTMPAGPGPDLLLLAGGTGLSPMKAIIQQVSYDPGDRKVTLVVGAAYQYQLYDMAAMTQLADELGWLTIIPALTDDPRAEDRATVAEAALRGGSWYDRQIYVCGSPAMVAGTCRALLDKGYAPENLHVEQYDGTTYAPLQTEQLPGGVFAQVTHDE